MRSPHANAVARALPDAVTWILASLTRAGYAAYAVGGCVRDVLMGRIPHDWDVCTSAAPGEVHAVFAGSRLLDTGIQHGTVTLLLDQTPYEITTFRADGAYSDNRHPDSVSFVPRVETDLARRDFTVNAMAYAPQTGLVDCFGGLGDLALRRIRCVGDPDTRFCEDGLRILRALRFASALEFTVEEETAAAVRRNAALLDQIARERVREELTKLLCAPGAKQVLLDYADVVCRVLPELAPCVGFDQRNRHHHLPLYDHIVEAVCAAPPDPVVRLALLLHDVGKPEAFTMDAFGVGHFYGHPAISARMAEAALKRLRFDRASIDAVTLLVREHDAMIPPTERAVRRWLGRLGEIRLGQLLAVQRADALAHAYPDQRLAELAKTEAVLAHVLAARPCVTLGGLAVSGRDVIALGVPEGREVGRLLAEALDAVIDGAVENEREALLAFIEERIGRDRA